MYKRQVLVYAGAAQFAMISLIAAHSSILNMALTVCLINLRNMLMSLHTSSDFKDASLAHTIGIGSPVSYTHLDVYKRQGLSSLLETEDIRSKGGKNAAPMDAFDDLHDGLANHFFRVSKGWDFRVG